MGDRLGQQFGNYRLVKLLGKGAFAEVYQGQHKHVASLEAAIKILDLEDVDVDKFRNEAVIIAKLDHSHIMRLLDFDFQQETPNQQTPFLVLNYAPQGSLRDLHPKGTVVPLATVIRYVKDIASALQYAHDRHIIHRDVKPENILVSRSGEVLLSDFGIAMLSKTGRTSLDVAAHKAGTPYYMAPEMVRGKPEKASDQYALGIVVYEWLCGTPPFTEGDIFQLGGQHIIEPVPPLREKLSTISPQVEAVVLKALEKKPEDRYPSVQEFATALDQASQHQQQLIAVKEPVNPTQSVVPIQPVPFSSDKPVGTTILIYRGHTNPVSSVAWSPDGKYIVSCSYFDRSLQVWKAATGELITEYKGLSSIVYPSNVWSSHIKTFAIWSPDGKYIASGDGITLQVWDVTTGELRTEFSNVKSYAAWSPDGEYIVFGSYSTASAQVRVVASGELRTKYEEGDSLTLMGTAAWSPDGKYIVTGYGFDKIAEIWDADTGKRRNVHTDHSNFVKSVAWSPNGKYIASGSNDGTVQVWEADTGKRSIEYKRSSGTDSVAWSPDGEYIASGGYATYDNTVHVWVAPQ